jgi:cellulose synthase/poly-beta-1,6-N-acetylglucosamine synthase-like glycosyltransferase
MTDERHPFFSIVVPTFERPGQLASCLQSLARMDYPGDRFEVIVVDDGAEAPSHALIAGLANKIDVTLLRQSHAGPAAARNHGAARARGDFLAFTDDDCRPAPNWLKTLSARLANTPGVAVGGRTLNALSENPYSSASQILIDYLYAYYDAAPGQARFLTSNNLAFPTAPFRSLGGFDTLWNHAGAEDRELCDRWRAAGHRMIYTPEALVYHAHFLTFRSYWRQHFNYGRGAYLYHCSRARRGKERIKVEPPMFYLGLLRYPYRQPASTPPRTLAALLLVAQAANLAGFLWARATAPAYRERSQNHEAVSPSEQTNETRSSAAVATKPVADGSKALDSSPEESA